MFREIYVFFFLNSRYFWVPARSGIVRIWVTGRKIVTLQQQFFLLLLQKTPNINVKISQQLFIVRHTQHSGATWSKHGLQCASYKTSYN